MQITQLNSLDPNVPQKLQQPADGSASSAGAAGVAPLASQPASTQEHPQQTASKVKDAVDVANSFMKSLSVGLTFSIDKDSGRTVVKVIDQSTDEVIKQIPSQEVLDIAKALDKLQGLMVKTQA